MTDPVQERLAQLRREEKERVEEVERLKKANRESSHIHRGLVRRPRKSK